MKKFVLLLTIAISLYGWDGYDYNKGSFVEIDKGNLVRSGNDIEYYDYSDGQYKNAEVQSIESYGNNVEVEVYDYDSGEFKTFEMDR